MAGYYVYRGTGTDEITPTVRGRPATAIEHGTLRGWWKHRRRGEFRPEDCGCQAAWNAHVREYQREYRRRQREKA